MGLVTDGGEFCFKIFPFDAIGCICLQISAESS
jgi:hypothetical protein